MDILRSPCCAGEFSGTGVLCVTVSVPGLFACGDGDVACDQIEALQLNIELVSLVILVYTSPYKDIHAVSLGSS